MRPKLKYHVIYRHRDEFPISVMCKFLGVSRSGYYAYIKKVGRPTEEERLVKMIRTCQKKCDQTYGYRRVCLWLKQRNVHKNPKTILRIMRKYNLLSDIRRHRKWNVLGRQIHRYDNLLNQKFHADMPNKKWVTDISYILTDQGTLYLSIIRDLYDNSIVAYKTASRQTANLVLDTIRIAMKKEKNKVAAELQLHSDQGLQYASQEYSNLIKEYGITPSMSRRGNCYDNAMAENFFSILKTECIYRHRPKTLQEAADMIDKYIHFYNYERIQIKTGMSPLMLRYSA